MLTPLFLLAGCGGMGEPEAAPARVEPEAFTRARSWVRSVDSDGESVVWANYDVSTGRSARAVIDSAPISGGEVTELVEERHPPQDLKVGAGFVYWLYKEGSLKRAPLAGGPVELIAKEIDASCFELDAKGAVYTIEATRVTVREPGTWTPRGITQKSLGDCPVVLGEKVYWNERKGIHTVDILGGSSRKLAEVKLPKGLLSFDGALYSCVSDILTRIDPLSGEATPIRSYCKPDGLAVRHGAHWFRAVHFKGWPPQEQVRVAEVTKTGVSWLFNGEGASPVTIVGDEIVWFGRPLGGSSDWIGYKVPLP